jgi:hypothetical protein
VNDQPSGAGGGDPQPGWQPEQSANPHPQQGGYPAQPWNYPPAENNYPPAQGGYPPYGGYPPQPGNVPPRGIDPPPNPHPYPYPYPQPQDHNSQNPNLPYPNPAPFPQVDQWSNHRPPPAAAPPTALRAGSAIAYGWTKFTANIGVWLGLMALYGAITVLFYTVFFFALFALLFSSSAFESSGYGVEFDNVGTTLGALAVSAVAGVVGIFAAAVLTRGSLLETDGARPTFGEFWRLRNIANIALYACVFSIMNAAAASMGNQYIGLGISLVLGILFWFVPQLLLDRDMPFHVAVVTSVSLLGRAPGASALLFLMLLAMNVVGGLLCGIGLLFTVPISVIAVTYSYRVLSGGFVSAAA